MIECSMNILLPCPLDLYSLLNDYFVKRKYIFVAISAKIDRLIANNKRNNISGPAK